MTIINNETNRIQTYTNCDYLDELIKALIKCNLQLLSNNNTENISYEKINLSDFIHKIYIECSRIFFKRPYLFQDYDIVSLDKQKNLKECEDIIKLSIENSVRKSLPFKLIINNYINHQVVEENSIEKMLDSQEKHFQPMKKETDNCKEDDNKHIKSYNSVQNKHNHNHSIHKYNQGQSKHKYDHSMHSNINKFICKNNDRESINKSSCNNITLVPHNIEPHSDKKIAGVFSNKY